jgi:hypothetical protein
MIDSGRNVVRDERLPSCAIQYLVQHITPILPLYRLWTAIKEHPMH